MTGFRFPFPAMIVGLTLTGSAVMVTNAQTPPMPDIRTPDILQSYIYGYAPVAMEATRAIETAVPDALVSPGRAPVNQFGRSESLATPNSRLVIRPNADMLYTSAWLDLAGQPLILHVPDTTGRYYLIPLYDAYSNEFASVGSRTTGNSEGNYAIIGPHWRGTLPNGLSGVLRAPTNTVWALGRTLVRGAADLPAAVAVTTQYQLVPLSDYAGFIATGVYTPPTGVPVVAPNPNFVGFPVTASPGFSMPEYFSVLGEYFLRNLPPPQELRQAVPLALYGLANQNLLTPTTVAQADADFITELQSTAANKNGWSVNLNGGTYGTNYLLRAAVARFGLGANIPADAVYASMAKAADGGPLVGTNAYVMHFEPGQTPPVNGFWSLTVYDQAGVLVPNPINRYDVGSETGLVPNADGSIDIFLQNAPPTATQANWLPTPAAPFNLTLRFFWPAKSVLDGTYEIPPVTQVVAAGLQ